MRIKFFLPLLLLGLGRGLHLRSSIQGKSTIPRSQDNNRPAIKSYETPVRPQSQRQSASKLAQATSYGQIPLAFEPNQGQASEEVKFLSRGHGVTFYLTSTEAVLQLPMADLGLPIDKTDRVNGFDHQDPFHLSVPLDFHQFTRGPDSLNRQSQISNLKPFA